MQINKKKLERQQIGVKAWFDASCKGCLHYFTGVGKTYTAILIIKRLLRLNNKESIVIIVPSEELQNQWNTILQETFNKTQLNTINVFTSHYIIINNIRIQTDTLIIDELHEYYSEEHLKVIDGTYIKFNKNLGLTATYKDSKGRQKYIKNIYPIIDEIDDVLLAAPKIFRIPLEDLR